MGAEGLSDEIGSRERREKLVSATAFRRVLILVLFGLVGVGMLADAVPVFSHWYLLFAVGLLCNEWARINFRDDRRVAWSLFGALAVDVVGLTMFVYLTGGAGSYLLPFYVVQVVGTAVLARHLLAVGTAAASVVALGALALAEQTNLLPRWSPPPTGAVGLALQLAGFAAAMAASAYCAGVLAERLRLREHELGRANAELARLARHDGLTGLLNRRALDLRLTEECERAKRFQKSFSILLCDIDRFKAVNDQHGHGTGDLVLQQVARSLSGSVRSVDFVGRYGGEEFLILLPEIGAVPAVAAAERVRQAVAASTIPFEGGSLGVTVSVGLATYPANGADPAGLVAAADRRLYRAKAEGRDRVVAD